MICPLSSVEPLKHSARPPIFFLKFKTFIKSKCHHNHILVTELLGWVACTMVKIDQALSMKMKKCPEK